MIQVKGIAEIVILVTVPSIHRSVFSRIKYNMYAVDRHQIRPEGVGGCRRDSLTDVLEDHG